ncbi:hypothetical protein CJF32_00010971 [Rutstroemia sp. NJR-2017a WRK4]|nr:hypothetical protein CJF32_00010971 [Rutstroemia sp. NJR-2017a WRK4]
MCAGDMTIESAIPKADGGKNQVDGMGMMHQCKSWVCYSTKEIILSPYSPYSLKL